MKTVKLITDGSCLDNPGRGGWAAILRFNGFKKEIWGSEPQTTNNRMEMMAVLRGLQAIRESCEVAVEIDSEYVRNGITKWMTGWKRNGWRTASKEPVKNKDLWEQLDRELARHKMTWTWVKGHADHEDNNRCDELARQAAMTQSHSEATLAPSSACF